MRWVISKSSQTNNTNPSSQKITHALSECKTCRKYYRTPMWWVVSYGYVRPVARPLGTWGTKKWLESYSCHRLLWARQPQARLYANKQDSKCLSLFLSLIYPLIILYASTPASSVWPPRKPKPPKTPHQSGPYRIIPDPILTSTVPPPKPDPVRPPSLTRPPAQFSFSFRHNN